MTNAVHSKSNLHPQLAEIVRQLDEASEDARRIAGRLDADGLRRRPGPGQWSIAECLIHLNLSSRAEIDVLDDVFAQPTREKSASEAKYKMDLLGRFLKWSLEPPVRSWSKIKTTAEFRPPDADFVEQALPDFLNLQEQLKVRVERANNLPLDKIKVVSPFNRRVRYNLLSCFHILLAHERRHLWQAEQAGKQSASAG